MTRLEKVLHEIIRDIPEAEEVTRLFDNGMITFDEALNSIAFAYREEKERSES